jgi:hypothetical protein
MTVLPARHRSEWLRLGLIVTICATIGVLLIWPGSSEGAEAAFPKALAKPHCGPGAHPETSIDGRVPLADFRSGRAAKGYRCNTVQVSHQGASGGFKVIRYTDVHGNTCAYYDSTLTLPKDVLANLISGDGLGVVVLDMNDPRHPRKTANLTTPAMLSPHESLLLNTRRGLLAADMGTAATAPGFFDIYDVHNDCRHPQLMSSTLSAILGHESGFAPDGKTFYASSATASLVAIDVTNPRQPRTIFTQLGVQYHGLRLSDDGRTMYVANIGTVGLGGITDGGLRILDVSQIQDRTPNPSVPVRSSLSWREVSIPQVAEPFTRNGHHYVFEVDEFVDLFTLKGLSNLNQASVGAARIIDVQDPRHPRVVSNIRLRVQQPDARRGAEKDDPGAWFPAQGYAAHYCSMPTRTNPNLAACSMILSGLRVFDIRDVKHPREVAYFNKPLVSSTRLTIPLPGGYAMSQPAWDRKRKSIWYSDVNSGFYDVKLTNRAAALMN